MTYSDIYRLSLTLMDEVLPSGSVDASATAEYLARAPGLLTVIQAELSPVSGVAVTPVSSMSDECLLSDFLAAAVLPYGLAAHLLLAEHPAAAAFFQQRYEELRSRVPARARKIRDVYNVGGGV